MAQIKIVKGEKYIRLNTVTFACLKEEKHLLDSEFAEKVQRAYHSQVCLNHGWGFTVKHKGYRVRFDLQNSTGYKLPRIYEGYVLEKPAFPGQQRLAVALGWVSP